MSRRPNPAAEKAAANQQIIKSLLKLPGNRVCADCKRNKLPRWASWNLGIFVCIRCSGIHRGMGTHISRVKSVDLDTWTDEQIQSMVKWGNDRANKYWESRLAPGHVPSEAKIENFVRTKYESKRWVMESGMPDPATLDDSDEENIPLRVVQQKLESRQPAASAAATAGAATLPPAPPQQRQQPVNLFDDDESSAPPPPKREAAANMTSPQRGVSKADSSRLFGGDFFGMESPSSRPSSVNSNPSAASRPDLKSSILSLYSSAPKPVQVRGHAPSGSLPSPLQSPTTSTSVSALTDFNNAFGSLSFQGGSQLQQQQAAPQAQQPMQANSSPFANLTTGMKKSAPTAQLTSSMGFFAQHDKKPAPVPTPSSQSGLGDLFDFGAPAAAVQAQTNTYSSGSVGGGLSFDNNAWSTPAPASTSSATAWNNATVPANAWSNTLSPSLSSPSQPSANTTGGDEEWGTFSGGGTTSSGAGTGANTGVKTKGSFDDDLFGNVWK